HILGTFSGLLVAVPVWYVYLIAGDINRYGSEKLPVPGALIWKAVSEVLMKGLGFLDPTAQAAVIIGAIIGLVFEISKQVTKNKFPLSAMGLGLAFVLRFADIWMMFLGALLFWMLEQKAKKYKAPEPDKGRATYREKPEASAAKKPFYVIAA